MARRIPADTSFDLKLGGFSWMDYIAERGFDVWMVDLPGYGKSTRPPQMDQAADKNPPLVPTEDAVKNVGTVIDMILAKRHLDKLDLIGWSWGTTIMATYTARHDDKVDRLVLYAPVWIAEGASPFKGPIPAYRTVTKEDALKRWVRGVAPDKAATLIPRGWFDTWANATWSEDPIGAKQSPPVLRAPNGVIEDFKDIWFAGKSTYDPAKITVPVLLIQGEWDADTPPYMSHKLFSLLTNTPMKRYVLIGEGTHHVDDGAASARTVPLGAGFPVRAGAARPAAGLAPPPGEDRRHRVVPHRADQRAGDAGQPPDRRAGRRHRRRRRHWPPRRCCKSHRR